MKISTQTRFAIRFLLELRKSQVDDMPITISQVATKQGISNAYLESIATKLRKHGYIKSYRGPGGGYLFARPVEDITLGEIMRLMESTYYQVHCVNNPEESCVNYDNCLLADAWENLEDGIDDIVNNIKLSRFIEDKKTSNIYTL